MVQASLHPVASTCEWRLQRLARACSAIFAADEGDAAISIGLQTSLEVACLPAGAFWQTSRDVPGQVLSDPGTAPEYEQALREMSGRAMASQFGAGVPFAVPEPHGTGRTLASARAVPVCWRNDGLMGWMVYLAPDASAFDEATVDLLSAIASQVAGALEHERGRSAARVQAAREQTSRANQIASERQLRQALDAAQLGTWAWDVATDLISLDERAAEIYGVPPGTPQLRSELQTRIVASEGGSDPLGDLPKGLPEDGQYRAEYRIQTPPGAIRWVAASGLPFTREGGRGATGLTGTVQDVTARKLQEQNLLQSEKLAATGTLAATIAHEINNPLEAVINLIYLAKTDPGTPVPVRHLLETADGEISRVSQIAQQTLGFYRDTTRPVDIDLNEMFHAVVNLFSRKLASKQIDCTLDLDPGLSITGLQGEIRQVVSNLLVNAIDASSGAGSVIRIRGRHRHCNGCRGVVVLICDQGVGIPRHLHHRIFTPFVTTKPTYGTGLGLWVTRGMVEKHGGSVRFRSRTERPTGTVFRLYFPRTENGHIFRGPISTVVQ